MKKINTIFIRKYHLILVFLFSLGSLFATDIVEYSLQENPNAISGGGLFSVSSGLMIEGYGPAMVYGWNNPNMYYTISPFSTSGLHSINVSAMMNSEGNGPKNFKLQYNVNGTEWYDGGVITLSTTETTKTISLPADCANKVSVQVRWILTDNKDINGDDLTIDGFSYISYIRVSGSDPIVPNSQTSNITFVSITPTTITIDASPGNGDNRIAVINCENTFTNPVNDEIKVANSTYNYSSGNHEQVVYVGTGTQFTVTVPNSNNIYWVRYYEYDYNGSMTRYLTTTATNNPRQCALEAISTNSATSVRLTRADLGATISTPLRSNISQRGIYWGYASGINTSNSKLIKTGMVNNVGGSFTYNASNFNRSTRIYYKGYVTNQSGTILGDEKYFDNIPIFTGTGTWGTASLWNVLEVPGANGDVSYGSVNDSPIINGICELTASNNVTNLTINSAKKLTINKDVKMKVDGTLTNNAGTNGILIKSIDVASDASANGTLIFANGTPQGTVEMFSKASWNISNIEGSRYKWQYFGIPVTTLNYNSAFNFSGCYVRKWDESVESYDNIWRFTNTGISLQLASGSTLTSGLGYELVQENNHKYSFAGTLVHSDFSQSLPYTSSAYFKGQSVLSNPYTAAIDISAMVFGANTEAAVYTYNTGTYNEWLSTNAEFEPGTGPGTYTVTTKGAGGLTGILTQIPSMQGFIVKSTNVAGGSVSFPYASLIQNTEKQKSKASLNVGCMIDVIGTHYSDRMWILDDENCTPSFDNGYDGRKMLGSALASQLYGIQESEPYQIQAIKDLNETYLGFLPGTDTSFKLVFNHQNLDTKYSKLYLVDLITNQTTDITATGTEYNFTATTSDLVKRFKIIANSGITTSIIESKNENLILLNQDNKLIIDSKLSDKGNIQIFDLAGKLQTKSYFAGNEITTFDTNLQKGIYIARLSVSNIEISKRLIIK